MYKIILLLLITSCSYVKNEMGEVNKNYTIEKICANEYKCVKKETYANVNICSTSAGYSSVSIDCEKFDKIKENMLTLP